MGIATSCPFHLASRSKPSSNQPAFVFGNGSEDLPDQGSLAVLSSDVGLGNANNISPHTPEIPNHGLFEDQVSRQTVDSRDEEEVGFAALQPHEDFSKPRS